MSQYDGVTPQRVKAYNDLREMMSKIFNGTEVGALAAYLLNSLCDPKVSDDELYLRFCACIHAEGSGLPSPQFLSALMAGVNPGLSVAPPARVEVFQEMRGVISVNLCHHILAQAMTTAKILSASMGIEVEMTTEGGFTGEGPDGATIH